MKTMKTVKRFIIVFVVLMLINDVLQMFLEHRSYRKKLNQQAAKRLIRTMERRAGRKKKEH